MLKLSDCKLQLSWNWSLASQRRKDADSIKQDDQRENRKCRARPSTIPPMAIPFPPYLLRIILDLHQRDDSQHNGDRARS